LALDGGESRQVSNQISMTAVT